MPAGSSLPRPTGKVLDHVEQILHNTPEVESTTRRTGLQMGLAAVTEANTGDITVKLKQQRSRGIDEVMADVRTADQDRPNRELDVEFTQVLQDMIGDLSNAPEPIQIKLFSHRSRAAQRARARASPTRFNKVNGVVDVENGIDNTISGPATNFQVDPQLAARMGFTPQEVAEDATSILDGVEAPNAAHQQRPPLHHPRPPRRRHAPVARDHREHRLQLQLRPYRLARLDDQHHAASAAERDPAREPAAARRRHRHASKAPTSAPPSARCSNASQAMHLPPSVRVDYGGTYQEQQKSFAELAARAPARAGSRLRRAAHRVPQLLRAHRHPHLIRAVHRRRRRRAPDHRNHLQRRQLHGTHHGHRHRRQKRHPAARRRRALSRAKGCRRTRGHAAWPRSAGCVPSS